jgi:hypothetical protein
MNRTMASLMLLLAAPLCAQENPSWKKLDFLLGKWVGVAAEKDTPLGAGQGAFSFDAELSRKIIVRHNRADYTSGASHDDLMIIYLEGVAARAIYFDSEGHVIRYNVAFPAENSVVFESDGSQPGPKYRLSYRLEKGALNGTFEVAPPGGEYKPYMAWGSRRQ